MSRYVENKVNDIFDEWLNKLYGVYGKVKYKCVKVHNYLGIKFYLYDKDKVNIDMITTLIQWSTIYPSD